jgi:hypothetical protein
MDDQFGGPEPDDAHLTGVILRLNDDGSTPGDNPFVDAGRRMGGEVGTGERRRFVQRAESRRGGIQLGMGADHGPPERLEPFKTIETTVTPVPPHPFATTYFALQQLRWSPENIAESPDEALTRLFMLPGAHYSAPEFAWKYEVSPGGIGFVAGRGISSSSVSPATAGA